MESKLSLGQRLYNAVSPVRIELSEKEDALLRAMFPSVDWDRVDCYEGMPWYARQNFAIAMVVPDTFGGGRARIHFKDYSIEGRYKIPTLVHEAFHVQQYQDTKSLPGGRGYFRRFMRYYFGWYFAAYFNNLFRPKYNLNLRTSGSFISRRLYNLRRRFTLANYHSYRYHPMEVPAYNHEGDFVTTYGYFKYSTVEEYFEKYPNLKRPNAGKIVRPPIWAWLLGSFIVLQIAILNPIIELFLWGLALALGGRKRHQKRKPPTD